MKKRLLSVTAALVMIFSLLSACSIEEQQPLPEYFSLADKGCVSASKCQNGTSLCWDYASIATAESAILTAGLAESVDLSEGHLYYYCYPYSDERAADSTEDGMYIPGKREDSPELPLNLGGSCIMAFSLFANGAGPANETDAPLDTDSAKISDSVAALSEKERSGEMSKYQGDWLLTDFSSVEFSSRDAVKRAIAEKGAFCTGIRLYTDKISRSADGNAYYTGIPAEEYVSSDHLLVLIGWDDSFPRENFGSVKPENDGAWIALDSTNILSNDDGILYISYEENMPAGYSVEMCRRSDYSDVLHYDLYSSDYIMEPKGETVIANVFSADKNGAVKSVGVTTGCEDQPLTIEVYVNPEPGKPDSGKRAAKLKATPESSGYHVIDLPQPVNISSGDTFSVVVSYKCGEEEFLGAAPVEGTMSAYSSLFCKPYITSEPGESFALHDGVWYDTSDEATAAIFGKEERLNNAAIKALMQ